jgi:hypothetical protein
MAFKLPIEITIPIVLPLLIVLAFVDQGFFSALGVCVLYVAFLLGKRYFSGQ